MSDSAISVRGLRKRYGAVDVLRGVDLDVRYGEVVAFLGPNGAGKTTTVEILEGFRTRSGGEVSVLGVDPRHRTRAWRERIGIVTQESEPDPGLTVREAVELYAGYRRRPRPVGEVLDLVGLAGDEKRLATSLSGGQRRRLDLATALVGAPDLLFLDEPTTGFDPAARRAAWDVIDRLRADGTTILLTTHAMDEADRLADRIAVIAGGTIVAEGTPETLGGRDRGASTIAFALEPGAAALPDALRSVLVRADNGRVTLRSTTPLDHVETLAAWSREQGLAVHDLTVARTGLEDVYLSLTRSEVAS